MAAISSKYPFGSAQEHVPMCENHELIIDLTCEDCNEFICSQCAKSDHKDHDWKTIHTAGILKRKQLKNNLSKVKEEDEKELDETIRNAEKLMENNQECFDSEVSKLQKHYDEIVSKLDKTKKNIETKLKENLEKTNAEIQEKKLKACRVMNLIKFIEENHKIMSDYSLITHLRELTNLISERNCNSEIGKLKVVSYKRGDINDGLLESMMGQTFDSDDTTVTCTETDSLQRGAKGIIAEKESSTEPYAYLNWGPDTSFNRCGLATYQHTAQILTKDGKAELQIRILKQMQFTTKLKHNDRNDADLEGYVIHRIVGNTVYFNIIAPSRGKYRLEIYANDAGTESSTLYHVAQYLVECNEDVTTDPLPKLPDGYLGDQPKFNDYGLNTLSHHIPVIHLETNTVEIQFSVAQAMRATANLIEMESDREMEEFVFTQTKDSVVSFIVNCPSVGFYKLQLYAIPVHDPSQQLPGVFNYLINCQRKTKNVYPFPKQYSQWKEGCYMWEPLVVHKEIGKPKVNFHVKIPKAEAVAVVTDQEWTHLQSSQPGIWQGEVNLAPYYGKGVKVTVNANYGKDKITYVTLLEYSI